MIYYSHLDEYIPPRRHYFVCSQGIGTSLEKLLDKPVELKAKMVENCGKHCFNVITSTAIARAAWRPQALVWGRHNFRRRLEWT